MARFPLPRRCAHLLFPVLLTCSAAALAVPVTDELDVGGAIRARFDHDPDRDIDKAGFDTLMLRATYTSDSWIGAARYRFYGKQYPYQYTDHIGDVAFAEYAWVGYRFDAERQVQVGLNQIPFGLQPFFGSTFYETLGNVVGLRTSRRWAPSTSSSRATGTCRRACTAARPGRGAAPATAAPTPRW